jgi:hypothetical protein
LKKTIAVTIWHGAFAAAGLDGFSHAPDITPSQAGQGVDAAFPIRLE